MLFVTSDVGEKVAIGQNVKVTVLGIKEGRILIRIDAPNDVQINRAEWLSSGQRGIQAT